MKNFTSFAPLQSGLWISTLVAFSMGCSSSSNLRKFKDDEPYAEIPADVAKKFEVKDVAELNAKAKASPTPSKKVKTKVEKKEAKKVEPVIPPARRVEPMPFEIGEKLSYGIRYLGVTAAYFNLELLPYKVLNERKVYHIRGIADTVALFELVYRVNDTIESFWDADGLYSTKYTMDFDESKQTRKVVELYDYEKRQSYYWNRVDHSERGFSEQKEKYDISLWSQDPISSLYYVRTLNLPQDNTKETRFPIILDGKPWEGAIKFIGKERIYAGGKYFEAIKYNFETYQNGEIKNKDNTIWISDDSHRYILRIEAKVKIGTFAIALDKIL